MNKTMVGALSREKRELLLQRIKRERATRTPGVAIERASDTERSALSFAQQRLWFLSQLDGVSAAYHMPAGLRLRGALDQSALRCALDRLVERHESLRTTFDEIDGEPVQKIRPAQGFALREHDLRGMEDAEAAHRGLVDEEARAPFDLRQGPLCRGRLIRTADEEYTLLLTQHHIVSDGWSMGVLMHELSALYGAYSRGEADPLPALSLQYADYAAWQRRWVSGEVLQAQG
ncbi:condensation domain-containing protein, partial [Lysobacter sp. ESA13C]|uniref:condensation domain-containing protein n=1 Tax=Lysobacter sp. ESA13C TaxID=2862676 RepID=UPI001CBDB3E6